MDKKSRARLALIKKKLAHLYLTGYSIEELRKASLEIIIFEQYLKDLKEKEKEEIDVIEDLLEELEKTKLIIYRMFTASKIKLPQRKRKHPKRVSRWI